MKERKRKVHYYNDENLMWTWCGRCTDEVSRTRRNVIHGVTCLVCLQIIRKELEEAERKARGE